MNLADKAHNFEVFKHTKTPQEYEKEFAFPNPNDDCAWQLVFITGLHGR